jgi:hypothetical protein
MKNVKKCGMTSECWSGFVCVLGVAFIIVATILTLITMNGLGILGMFVVGAMFCRHKCPCCASHNHDAHDEMCSSEDKTKPKKVVVKK